MRRTGYPAPNRRARVGRGVTLPPLRAAPVDTRPEAETPAAGLILVGRFGAPQGVHGSVRVQSFTGDPSAIGAYGALTDAAGVGHFALTDLRVLRDAMLVANVEGVTDRDAAAALTGTALFTRRENLPPPDEDEVYVADLIGIAAVDTEGDALGTVVGVPNYGAGDLLEIAPADGGDTLLVPFTKAFVPDVDVAARKVVVVVPSVDDDPTSAAEPP